MCRTVQYSQTILSKRKLDTPVRLHVIGVLLADGFMYNEIKKSLDIE